MTTARKTNLSKDSGQFDDMIDSKSDDGTIPPSAESEAITTGAKPERTIFEKKMDLIPEVRPAKEPKARPPNR